MQNRRQHLLRLGIGIATSAGAGPLFAQSPMQDTARILAGFAPGGTIDTEARSVATHLSGSYAKAVVVDNRPGAGGQIAISALKAAHPDGSTLLVTPMSMLGIYIHTYKKLAYDPVADLVPVTTAVQVDMGLAVGPMVPASVKTVPDFLAWCRAHPDQANFGSPAAGSVPHFVGVLIGRAGQVNLQHVSFRGTQPAILDLIGGQIAAVSSPVGEFLPHLSGGKLRILGTSGATRSRFTPQVPTLAEQGFKDLVYSEWHGFFLPPKTPAAVVQRANAAIREALGQKNIVDNLAAMGLEVRVSSPEELAATLKADIERWRPIVKSIGFVADS